MLVHKGGKIKNWDGECRDVTPTKMQSQNIFKESTGGRMGGGGGRMDVNEELKSGRGCSGGGGHRVDVNEELKFLSKIKKKWGGDRGSG